MDQIFALQQILKKSWEYAQEVNACFVDLEKAYDRIPKDKLLAVLLQHGIGGQLLLTAIKSLYMHSEVCVRVNSATTKPFRVSVGLRQSCSLSPILFLIYMDKIVKKRNYFIHIREDMDKCPTRDGKFGVLTSRFPEIYVGIPGIFFFILRVSVVTDIYHSVVKMRSCKS